MTNNTIDWRTINVNCWWIAQVKIATAWRHFIASAPCEAALGVQWRMAGQPAKVIPYVACQYYHNFVFIKGLLDNAILVSNFLVARKKIARKVASKSNNSNPIMLDFYCMGFYCAQLSCLTMFALLSLREGVARSLYTCFCSWKPERLTLSQPLYKVVIYF